MVFAKNHSSTWVVTYLWCRPNSSRLDWICAIAQSPPSSRSWRASTRVPRSRAPLWNWVRSDTWRTWSWTTRRGLLSWRKCIRRASNTAVWTSSRWFCKWHLQARSPPRLRPSRRSRRTGPYGMCRVLTFCLI